jgi:Lon protease-like protein
MGGSRQLAMFPLSSVLFPGAEIPLHVFEPRYRELTDHCLAGDGEFGVVLISRGSEVGGGDQRFAVGTVARIAAASRFDDGRWALLVVGTHRIAVDRWLADAPYPRAVVDDLLDDADGAGDDARFDRATAAVRRVRTLLSELGSPAPVVADLGAPGPGTDGTRLWRLCSMAPLTALDGQRLLEAGDGRQRLTLLTDLCEARAVDLSRLLGAGPTDGPSRPPTASP